MNEQPNEQFEVMPYAVAGQQIEQLIGRFGGRGMARRSMGGGAPSRQAMRPAPAPARWSAPSGGPRYRSWGWPYRAGMPYPEPYWYGQPVPVPFEPEPFPADWAPEPPMEEAGKARNQARSAVPLPPGLQQAVDATPAARRPAYQYLGKVAELLACPAEPKKKGGYAGLYLLVFGPKGQERAYSGQSGNVRRRILQHKLFGRMLGRDISRFDVFVQWMPDAQQERRRAIEQAFHATALRLGVLTNQNREFEAEVIGEAWV